METETGWSVRAADRDLALDDLTYLNRMTTVGQVLPNVAHELNNALQVISGLIEMLSARSDLEPDLRDKVGRIGAQSARATEMVRDLVQFARRDAPGVTLTDIVKLLERTLGFRRYHLARARIPVTVAGCGAGEALARVDAHHVQQALLNLIINAEHSLVGRTDGRIDIHVGRAERAIEVRIADNGVGLPIDLASRAVDPFFTTKRVAAGLGLTVAASLARADGGDLRLDPGPDGGTVAVLTVPASAQGTR